LGLDDRHKLQTKEEVFVEDATENEEAQTSNCCFEHKNPGCDIASIEKCVCGLHKACCKDRWTIGCVTIAKFHCKVCT